MYNQYLFGLPTGEYFTDTIGECSTNKQMSHLRFILVITFTFISFHTYSQYCIPVVTGTATSCGIANITLANINNNSPDKQGYVDYTNISTIVYKGFTYTFSSSTLNTSFQDIGGWVDWNKDLDFADVGEKIIGPSKYMNGSPHLEGVVIPYTALTGTTTLRIVADFYGNAIDSCTTTQPSGDIEDYTLIIRDTVMVNASQPVSPQFTNPALNKKVLAIEIFSSDPSFTLNSLTFATTGTSNLGSISNAKVFYSGNTYSFSNNQYGTTFAAPSGTFTIPGNFILQPGINYFWLTYDVNGNNGDIIDAELTNIVVDAVAYFPTISAPAPSLTIKPKVCNYKTKRNNIWHFGYGAGLDFNGGGPVALTNGAAYAIEGTASIADKNGNLLFYTDGDTAWNAAHIPMPNGTGLKGGDNTSNQAALIIPQPDNDSIYYLFLTGAINDTGMYYCIIDMSRNGGFGDVIVKNILMMYSSTEKQNATPHANKRDVWALFHELNTSNYLSYLITPTDIVEPVISSIGAIPIMGGLGGQIKFSPDGSKVASAVYGSFTIPNSAYVEVLDFSSSTGILTNAKTILYSGATGYPYGIEFSPNSNLFYVGTHGNSELAQFDATLNSAALIAGSKTLLTNAMFGSLQLAPDGKIYVAGGFQPFASVINNPNTVGAGCGLSPNGVNLNGRRGFYGLANCFYQAAPPMATAIASDSTICPGNSVTLTGGNPALTYNWLPDNSLSSTTSTVVNTSPTNTTTYRFVVSNTGSCPDSAVVTVTVFPTPNIIFSGQNPICAGQSSNITAAGAANYVWSPGSGISATTGSVVTVFNSATYTIIATDTNSCTMEETYTFSINALPLIVVSGDSSVCSGVGATITANGGNTYTWQPSTGLTSTTSSVVTATPTSHTTYTVIGTDGNSCSNSAVFSLTISSSPQVIIGGNASLCAGGATSLSASGANAYNWAPSTGINSTTGQTVIASPGTTTSYTVIGADSNGCADSAIILITVDSIPVAIAGPNDTICPGEMIALTASGGNTYLWNTGSSSTSINILPTSISNYSVVVSNGNCSDSAYVTVSVNPLPGLSVRADTTIAPGAWVILTAIGSGTYTWFPASGLSCITCSSPIASPSVTTKYYITLTDVNGCSVMDSILVTVELLCNELFIPNVFSPNNDGQNDVVKIYGSSAITNVVFSIYNRWGEKVFETTGANDVWDGMHKNKLSDPAVYIYILHAVCIVDGSEVYQKGNISLLR